MREYAKAVLVLLFFVMIPVLIPGLFCISDTFATTSFLTLAIDSTTVTINAAPTKAGGAFRKTTGSTITASTSNATGYTLSISAPEDSGDDYDKLINSTNSSAKINSISSSITEEQYKAPEGTSYNNTWGYLPSKYCHDNTATSCTANTNYLPAPTIAGDVLDRTTTANTTVNTYTIGMGTRIDSTIEPGSYSNSFVIKLVANPIPYSISYISSSPATNMPPNISSTTLDTAVDISSTIPVRANYIFLGWCAGTITTASNKDSCTGTIYNSYGEGADLTWSIDQTAEINTLNLYAMWERYTMQNVDRWKDSIGIGEEATAIDIRDNKVYSVARLCMSETYNTCPDSKLWMTQNLDLIVGTSGTRTLTSSDSDINRDLGTTQGYTTSNGVITWTPDTTLNTPARITKHEKDTPSESVSGWGVDLVNPYQTEGDDYYIYPSGNNNDDTIYSTLSACLAAHSESSCKHYHVGNYYNWNAAVALNESSVYTSDLTPMPNSICPKGWRLPNGITGTLNNEIISEFNQLALANGITTNKAKEHPEGSNHWENTSYATGGFNKLRSTSVNAAGYNAPIYFVRSGYIGTAFLGMYAMYGALWSSTSKSQQYAYGTSFYSEERNEFYPADQHFRYIGWPIRCIAR